MEKADSCRRAASEAVADVEPPQLRDLIETTLEEASMVPGVLTIESAAATIADGRSVLEPPADLPTDRESGTDANTDTATDANTDTATDANTDTATDADHDAARDRTPDHDDRDRDADGIATQAAGVQLIYEGLRLTRSLAREEPWSDLETDRDADGAEAGDLEILAADILVARGFYLLARTDAAGKAVRTVQAFGRDQTRRGTDATDESGDRDAVVTDAGDDPAALDANLERDILELAVLTGAAAVGSTPSRRLLAAADALGDDLETPFPPAAECLDDLEPSLSDQLLEERATDRATSATDP